VYTKVVPSLSLVSFSTTEKSTEREKRRERERERERKNVARSL